MQSYEKKRQQLRLAEEALEEIEKIAESQLNKRIKDVIDQFWNDYFRLECPRIRRNEDTKAR